MPRESENNNGVPGADTDESCTTCHQYFDKEDECWGNYVPLTRDEEAILAQMRTVKEKVTEVKRRLKELETGPVAGAEAESRYAETGMAGAGCETPGSSGIQDEDPGTRRLRGRLSIDGERFTILVRTRSGMMRRNGEGSFIAASPGLRVYWFSSLSFFR
jgi:hypothetical protein